MSFAEALDRRDCTRVRRKLLCKLLVNGRCDRGIAWNLSEHGLFVCTGAELAPGDGAVISLRTPEGRRFVLEVTVPRQNAPSLTLARLAFPRVALRIEAPPAAWLGWIRELKARVPRGFGSSRGLCAGAGAIRRR